MKKVLSMLGIGGGAKRASKKRVAKKSRGGGHCHTSRKHMGSNKKQRASRSRSGSRGRSASRSRSASRGRSASRSRSVSRGRSASRGRRGSKRGGFIHIRNNNKKN